MAVDKAALFKARCPEDDVELPGVGTVRVRGLSRAEAMAVQAVSNTEARERRILALGMVDPQVTEAEAGQWQKAAPAGEIEPVTTAIARLSGMLDGQPKEAVKTFRGEPGSGV